MMDNLTPICYTAAMNTIHKPDGFKGERMIVLPTEAFQPYVKHPQVARLYLTDVGSFPKALHHYRERREGIEEYIFIYCMEGSGTIQIPGMPDAVLKEGDAFCIPPATGHRYFADPADPWSILWVHFKGNDCSMFPLEPPRVVRLNSSLATERLMFLFELLFRVLDSNYTLGNFIYISQVLALILGEVYFREKHSSTTEPNRQVTQIVRYMSSHLKDNLTLDDLADRFSLSKSYISQIFQKYTSHSPIDFYIRLRMTEACKQLRLSEARVYEVAESLGYQDPYYFSRIFKKVIGMSPREYQTHGSSITPKELL